MAAPQRKTPQEMASLYADLYDLQNKLATAQAQEQYNRELAVSLRKEIAHLNSTVKSAAKDWAGEA